jgi:hypothetical protein
LIKAIQLHGKSSGIGTETLGRQEAVTRRKLISHKRRMKWLFDKEMDGQPLIKIWDRPMKILINELYKNGWSQ